MAFEKPTAEELAIRFTYHPPRGDQPDRYEYLRKKFGELAKIIVDNTPCSPEQMRSLNALEEANFLANAAIARRE